ncbi:hypothetical protein OLMES_3747 [Oleiphilus messinensis]|uniref:Uncharacterized protein n=1 Tax=Oleiphilus messinensis TaxID=141451 RepID=A0A1Y0IB85_9GAMM|nr:hypothetical protein [Oleiphilus messinensis]ARU57768.1 hypothetical protein OLMES_3747 [Oleiphilus messinensis]
MKISSKKRNMHACHPIMRKGGVHEKTNSSKRSKAKRELKMITRESSRDGCMLLQVA